MVTLTEGQHAGEHVVSEAETRRSRDNITVSSGENLVAGTVLGRVTADGKYKQLDTGAGDGAEVAAALLFEAVDATAADAPGVAHVRACQINSGEIVWPTGFTAAQITTATAQLETAGIVLRTGA